MKVLVLGAGGIVGQHMRLYQPGNVQAVYTRTKAWHFYEEFFAANDVDVGRFLGKHKPDVIVNLVGENRPDVVEKQPGLYRYQNVYLPAMLGAWCDANDAHLVHASTQGVYDGNDAPYSALWPTTMPGQPVNAYGRQKLEAERYLADHCHSWTIARLTFVIGTRPIKGIGRANPFEVMVDQLSTMEPQPQVDDRWFSPCFAKDAAIVLWDLAMRGSARPLHPSVFNVGIPERVSRYSLAKTVDVWGNATWPTPPIIPVSHDSFKGFAARPVDTTYAKGALHINRLDPGISRAIEEYTDMHHDRAVELALFFGCGLDRAQTRLGLGFGYNHMAVAEDWRKADPKTDDEILEWYRQTTAYCWELSAYHNDVGFNYAGMCKGISHHLKVHGVTRPVALGDGIGDLTLSFIEHGMDGVYHDLAGSKTSEFAAFRFGRRNVTPLMLLTPTFEPPRAMVIVDAVIALDFFEHLPNVEEWARAVFDMLQPGGWFLAQNAFGIGDLEHEGSIPMHLTVNNKFVEGWTPLLQQIGFVDAGGGWWRKP